MGLGRGARSGRWKGWDLAAAVAAAAEEEEEEAAAAEGRVPLSDGERALAAAREAVARVLAEED